MKRLILLLQCFAINASIAMPTVKVFILAGQSNMEGQAVVDLTGKDYNEGKGTLLQVMKNRPDRFTHLRNKDGNWNVRKDVWVHYPRENQPTLQGPLGIGYTVYGGTHHFGPELGCGHVLGNAIDEPVLLIKCAWGGKSLYQDFRPPSAGGKTGPYYHRMIIQVRDALKNLEAISPAIADHHPELSGLIWYQGWNDGVDPANAIPTYTENLANLIRDVRRDLNAPQLPVSIGELTGPWIDAPPEWETLRKAQEAVANLPEFAGKVSFATTRDFVRRPQDSPNPGHGHHEFGNAETIYLVGEALGRQMLKSMGNPSIIIQSPSERHIFQRKTDGTAELTVIGKIDGELLPNWKLQYRLDNHPWQDMPINQNDSIFTSKITLTSPGWHDIELQLVAEKRTLATQRIDRIGCGDVFVVAGQSNSANHGEERLTSSSPHVMNFNGTRWLPCTDPQPGASGNNGSFIPPLGDLLNQKLNVPIGFLTTGIGATSVREWLPPEISFPNPPTITNRVIQQPDGHWKSDGTAFEMLVARMKSLGPNGFRAVLWHQGESDANQADPTRTLDGKLYAEYVTHIINDSRKAIGWDPPWMIAQASYHSPNDTGSEPIRSAQASLWKSGVALQGPDSDALRGSFRDQQGNGVHFSGPGLHAHAKAWADRLVPWINP
jgi:hypothetical protein